MKIWIVNHYHDWSIGTYAFATNRAAEARAIELWSEMIANAGGDEPDDDMIERCGSELTAYEEAASNCGADDGVMITVEAVNVVGAK